MLFLQHNEKILEKIMKNYMNLLRRAKIFRGVEEQDILAMLDCLTAVKKSFARGEFLYRAGERASMAALVLDGMFHIDREDYWGNNSILADVSEGELLGEVYSFLDDEPAGINAVAVRDSTVLLLDVKRIFQTCSAVCPHHAILIRNFAYVLAVKNRELTRKLEHMSQRTTRGKLLSYLSDQSVKQGTSCFDIPFNRQQLADFLAVDRSAMSKELGKLRDEGILEFDRNHFVLKQGREYET